MAPWYIVPDFYYCSKKPHVFVIGCQLVNVKHDVFALCSKPFDFLLQFLWYMNSQVTVSSISLQVRQTSVCQSMRVMNTMKRAPAYNHFIPNEMNTHIAMLIDDVESVTITMYVRQHCKICALD